MPIQNYGSISPTGQYVASGRSANPLDIMDPFTYHNKSSAVQNYQQSNPYQGAFQGGMKAGLTGVVASKFGNKGGAAAGAGDAPAYGAVGPIQSQYANPVGGSGNAFSEAGNTGVAGSGNIMPQGGMNQNYFNQQGEPDRSLWNELPGSGGSGGMEDAGLLQGGRSMADIAEIALANGGFVHPSLRKFVSPRLNRGMRKSFAPVGRYSKKNLRKFGYGGVIPHFLDGGDIDGDKFYDANDDGSGEDLARKQFFDNYYRKHNLDPARLGQADQAQLEQMMDSAYQSENPDKYAQHFRDVQEGNILNNQDQSSYASQLYNNPGQAFKDVGRMGLNGIGQGLKYGANLAGRGTGSVINSFAEGVDKNLSPSIKENVKKGFDVVKDYAPLVGVGYGLGGVRGAVVGAGAKRYINSHPQGFKNIGTGVGAIGGGLLGMNIGRNFGPWGALAGAALGAGGGAFAGRYLANKMGPRAPRQNAAPGQGILGQAPQIQADQQNVGGAQPQLPQEQQPVQNQNQNQNGGFEMVGNLQQQPQVQQPGQGVLGLRDGGDIPHFLFGGNVFKKKQSQLQKDRANGAYNLTDEQKAQLVSRPVNDEKAYLPNDEQRFRTKQMEKIQHDDYPKELEGLEQNEFQKRHPYINREDVTKVNEGRDDYNAYAPKDLNIDKDNFYGNRNGPGGYYENFNVPKYNINSSFQGDSSSSFQGDPRGPEINENYLPDPVQNPNSAAEDNLGHDYEFVDAPSGRNGNQGPIAQAVFQDVNKPIQEKQSREQGDWSDLLYPPKKEAIKSKEAINNDKGWEKYDPALYGKDEKDYNNLKFAQDINGSKQSDDGENYLNNLQRFDDKSRQNGLIEEVSRGSSYVPSQRSSSGESFYTTPDSDNLSAQGPFYDTRGPNGSNNRQSFYSANSGNGVGSGVMGNNLEAGKPGQDFEPIEYETNPMNINRKYSVGEHHDFEHLEGKPWYRQNSEGMNPLGSSYAPSEFDPENDGGFSQHWNAFQKRNPNGQGNGGSGINGVGSGVMGNNLGSDAPNQNSANDKPEIESVNNSFLNENQENDIEPLDEDERQLDKRQISLNQAGKSNFLPQRLSSNYPDPRDNYDNTQEYDADINGSFKSIPENSFKENNVPDPRKNYDFNGYGADVNGSFKSIPAENYLNDINQWNSQAQNKQPNNRFNPGLNSSVISDSELNLQGGNSQAQDQNQDLQGQLQNEGYWSRFRHSPPINATVNALQSARSNIGSAAKTVGTGAYNALSRVPGGLTTLGHGLSNFGGAAKNALSPYASSLGRGIFGSDGQNPSIAAGFVGGGYDGSRALVGPVESPQGDYSAANPLEPRQPDNLGTSMAYQTELLNDQSPGGAGYRDGGEIPHLADGGFFHPGANGGVTTGLLGGAGGYYGGQQLAENMPDIPYGNHIKKALPYAGAVAGGLMGGSFGLGGIGALGGAGLGAYSAYQHQKEKLPQGEKETSWRPAIAGVLGGLGGGALGYAAGTLGHRAMNHALPGYNPSLREATGLRNPVRQFSHGILHSPLWSRMGAEAVEAGIGASGERIGKWWNQAPGNQAPGNQEQGNQEQGNQEQGNQEQGNQEQGRNFDEDSDESFDDVGVNALGGYDKNFLDKIKHLPLKKQKNILEWLNSIPINEKRIYENYPIEVLAERVKRDRNKNRKIEAPLPSKWENLEYRSPFEERERELGIGENDRFRSSLDSDVL